MSKISIVFVSGLWIWVFDRDRVLKCLLIMSVGGCVERVMVIVSLMMTVEFRISMRNMLSTFVLKWHSGFCSRIYYVFVSLWRTFKVWTLNILCGYWDIEWYYNYLTQKLKRPKMLFECRFYHFKTYVKHMIVNRLAENAMRF